jgi:SAM-dependent methyltransferase
MQDEQLLQFLLAQAEQPFSGWDFSFIGDTGRLATAPLSWSYTSLLLFRLSQSRALLDMGTGGGEYLAMLQPLPPHTSATEGYAPNIPIARARLEPLGVQVAEVGEDNKLPFADGQFDLVINRHEAFDAAEVYRVLQPGGWFITQQVGGQDCLELNKLLGAPAESDWADWNAATVVGQLTAAGFAIERQLEEFPASRFYDVGAIVYYLKAIPWQIEDFSVAKYLPALQEVHAIIERQGFIDVPSHRFLVTAQRKADA